MNKLNYILQAAGFDSLQDLLGVFAPYFPKILIASIYMGGSIGFVETYTGISVMLWVFITAASIFDLGLGLYANVSYLGQPYESKKMFRGIFKAFVLMVLIFLTNTFKVGVEDSNIYPEYLQSMAVYATATIHYTSVLLIGIYILLGVAENGAKIEIPFCVSLVRLLKIKIKKLEENE
ncbi:holin [Winogradskyella phage Peternella_1]|uniref:Holin n=1 Tax=Winogradskyella phage Peternella_1 TaxID=2745699 RepID=A0A8E4ZKB2_9CAUD|nr:holin [Winogradskyella phage Peternella_1]QQV91593.1 holin [Winogradskyella phage Peternella_1]